MTRKKPFSQETFKTVLIIVLLAAVIGLLGVIIFRTPQTKVVYQTAPAPQGKSAKRSDVSPYVANEVRNTITKKWQEMNGCYLKFLKSTPTPQTTDGIIAVDWQVDPNGAVISPEIVSSQINHPVLEQCLISELKTWHFPPPPLTGRNTYVLYKFKFKKTE